MLNEPLTPQLHRADNGIAVVSLPSSSTFAIPQSEVRGSLKNFQAMTYQLEELLPMDGERMSICMAGTLFLATDGTAILDWWQSQSAPLPCCVAVVPRAILIAQALMNQTSTQPTSLDRSRQRLACVVASDDSFDVMLCEGAQLQHWSWASRSESNLMEALKSLMDSATPPTRIVCVGAPVPPSSAAELQRRGIAAESCTASADDLLAQAVSDIQQGTHTPLANLNSGPLAFVDALAPARSSLKALAAAVAVGVLALCGAMNWRAEQYRNTADAAVAEQELLFQRVFPKQSIPVGILSRMESEQRRLSAVKGVGTDVPEVASSLPVMHKFWLAMPTEARYAVDVVHFTPQLLKTLDGHAKSFDDLEKVRQALLAQGFEVPALSAKQSSRGVSLRLDAVPLNATEQAAANQEAKR